MKKCIFLVVILLAGLGFCKLSYAMVMHISGAQLTRQADVVISGEVIKVEQAGRMEKVLGAQESEIYNATIKIVKIFKGEVKDPNIVVEFIKILDNVEADVQGAQFAVGSRGKAYLKKLPNGHYTALGGWLNGWSK